MGSSTSHLQFKQKYCDKKYTKNDLDNPEVFNIDQLDNDAGTLMRQHKGPHVELIKDCADVVRESPENVTMEIKGDIDPSLVYGLRMSVELQNHDRNSIHNLGARNSNNGLDRYVYVQSNHERPYVFGHSSSVRMYFRSLWQRSRY